MSGALQHEVEEVGVLGEPEDGVLDVVVRGQGVTHETSAQFWMNGFDAEHSPQ